MLVRWDRTTIMTKLKIIFGFSFPVRFKLISFGPF